MPRIDCDDLDAMIWMLHPEYHVKSDKDENGLMKLASFIKQRHRLRDHIKADSFFCFFLSSSNSTWYFHPLSLELLNLERLLLLQRKDGQVTTTMLWLLLVPNPGRSFLNVIRAVGIGTDVSLLMI